MVELVLVILVLGILSAVALPKIINVSDDAHRAVVRSTSSAFQTGVNQVKLRWLINGENTGILNFIKLDDPSAGGDLSVNASGFPADTRGNGLTLNTQNDCIDVWNALLGTENFKVAHDDAEQFRAFYHGDFTCSYFYNAMPSLFIHYNSNDGSVTTNA